MTHPIEAYIARTPGESRKKLAERAGLSVMHLYRLIQGEGEVSTKSFRAVSRATGGVISVAELVIAFERGAAGRDVKAKRKGREPTAA